MVLMEQMVIKDKKVRRVPQEQTVLTVLTVLTEQMVIKDKKVRRV